MKLGEVLKSFRFIRSLALPTFSDRVQDALDIDIFQSFVDGLKAHRENRLGLADLIEHCRDCLRPIKVTLYIPYRLCAVDVPQSEIDVPQSEDVPQPK